MTIYVVNHYCLYAGPARTDVLYTEPKQAKNGKYPIAQDIGADAPYRAWRYGYGEACVLPGKTVVELDVLR